MPNFCGNNMIILGDHNIIFYRQRQKGTYDTTELIPTLNFFTPGKIVL